MSTDRDVWGKFAQHNQSAGARGWLDHPWILENRVFPLVFGGRNPGSWWNADALAALGVPIGGRWLSIGCGGGGAEIALVSNGVCDSMLAIDPSPGAIEVAKGKLANHVATLALTFEVWDVNTAEFPAEEFDVVHVNMALHHVLELEHVLAEINRTLRPGGFLVANEYVGPSQFQFTIDRMRLVRDCLTRIPESLRWNPNERGVKQEQPRLPRSFWDEFDPTESVRSDEIEAVLRLNFPELEVRPYGGNLLNLVLENIVQNFDFGQERDRSLMAELFRAEDELLRQEPSDFAYFVCPKGAAEDLSRGLALAHERRGRFVRRRDPLDEFLLRHVRSCSQVGLDATSGSARPVIGPVIEFAKRVVRRGLRWYLEPLVVQQNKFNQAVLVALECLAESGSIVGRPDTSSRTAASPSAGGPNGLATDQQVASDSASSQT